MKLLHTSDWHLGAALYDAPRYEEHKAFLGWLTDLIASEHIDALLVAGDIFDKVMPPNDAAGLYYSFLAGLQAQRPGRCAERDRRARHRLHARKCGGGSDPA